MAFMRGFGCYLPEAVVGNEELAARLGCDPAWIASASGILERRRAGEQETVVTMAARAARDCLERSGVAAEQVGLVIAAGGSAERRFPGPAAEIAHALGMAGTPAIDLPMASAGAVFGLALAGQLAPAYGNVLVVASEKMSAVVEREPLDRNTAILFGDGAGAALVSAEAEAGTGAAEIRAAVLHSDGAFAGDLRLGFDGPLHMNGQVVILQSSRKIPGAIAECLERAGIAAGDVDAFLMHQANRNLMTRVAKALAVPPGTFYSNIERYGNTSSASLLIAAAEWSREAGFRPGTAVAFAGFGAGFHWGALAAVGV